MRQDEITLRPAVVADVPALARLRAANAEAHLALDPQTYRVPSPEAVTRYFTTVLRDGAGRDAVLVAEGSGRLVGMVEVLRNPEPPDHQILRPRPSAQIHTVVLAEARDRGVGAILVAAAVEWATARGIAYLSAGIHHANGGAVGFYRRHGFTDSGISLVRELRQ